MPRRMVPCCTEKTVLIAVYVEKPKSSRRFSLNHHQSLHDQHAIIKQEVVHYKNHGAGFDRRAELLSYSRRLRESATPSASTPSQPKPVPPSNHQPLTRSLSVQRKQKHSRTPNCLSNWKILIPSFLKSFTSKEGRRKRKPNGFSTDKIKSVMKSFEVRKNLGFISNLLPKLRKRR